MKKINRGELVELVAEACINANLRLSNDVCTRIDELTSNETHPRAKSILEQIKENQSVAQEKRLPLCQDTGICLMIVKLGNQVSLDFDLYEALNEGIGIGYTRGNLRKSVVGDPLFRENTGDNTPGVIHVELTNDDTFEVIVAPKGAGSENMSNLKMFTPQTPIDEIEDYVYDCVCNAHGKPCPPIILGVGIGGTFEMAAINAKKAVLEPVGQHNSKHEYEQIEKRLINRINESGIGPMGLGGMSTCLDVSIRQHASHIASLAVAVNIQCHVARHEVIKL